MSTCEWQPSAVHLGVIFTQNCVVTGDQAGSGGGRCQWTPRASPVVTVSGAGADVQGGVWRTAPDLCPSLLRLLPRLADGPLLARSHPARAPWCPQPLTPCRPSLRKGSAPQAEAPSSPRPWSPVQWPGLSRALQILGPPGPRLCPPPPRAPQSQPQGLIGYVSMRTLLMSGFMHFNQCNGPAASHPVPRGHSTQVSEAAVGPGSGKGWGQVTGSSRTLQGALRGRCPRLGGAGGLGLRLPWNRACLSRCQAGCGSAWLLPVVWNLG